MKEYIFEKVSVLKDKFKTFFGQKKKIAALENYSLRIPAYHRPYLTLIRQCMSDGFLDQEEGEFLNHMTNKYFNDKNYLDYAHSTRWLRKEIGRLKKESIPHVQHPELFNWDKVNNAPAISIPHELLAASQMKQQTKRI